jgi:hypothetical protein
MKIPADMTAKDALATARAFALQARMGGMSYDHCKELCKPYLALFNEKAGAVAKKFGKRYSPLTITTLLR